MTSHTLNPTQKPNSQRAKCSPYIIPMYITNNELNLFEKMPTRKSSHNFQNANRRSKTSVKLPEFLLLRGSSEENFGGSHEIELVQLPIRFVVSAQRPINLFASSFDVVVVRWGGGFVVCAKGFLVKEPEPV